MTWFLYRKPDGLPDLLQHKLDFMPGYRFIGQFDERPEVSGKRFNDADELVDNPIGPAYVEQRRYAYPAIGDQLDALWKAIAPMVDHPAAQEVLDKIAAVKAKYPKG